MLTVSGLKIDGYKNFLRMHFANNILTIYPIGLRRASKWKRFGEIFKANEPLKPELIDKPIVIDLNS
jgi:hypothetical protein